MSQSMRMSDPIAYEMHKSLAERDIELYVPQLVRLMNWNCRVEAILDYGCGAGSVVFKHLLPIAKTKDASITGIDISNEMIQFANNNYMDSRIKFWVGDIMDSEFNEKFKSNSYDKIFSLYCVQFLKDYRKAFQRFHKILKPNGEIGFTMVTKGSVLQLFPALANDAKWSKYMTGIENWMSKWPESQRDTEVLLENYVVDAGFKIKYIKTNANIYTGPIDTLVELFVSINPFLWRIPNEQMSEFKAFHKKVIMKFCKTNVEKNPIECDIEYEMIICLAMKK